MRLAAVVLTVLIPTAAAATPRVELKLITGAGPCGLASGFRSLWIANDGAGTIVRIDPVRNRIVQRIRIAKGICPVAVAGTSVWVASYRTDTVYRVSPSADESSVARGSRTGPPTSRSATEACGSPTTTTAWFCGSTSAGDD